MQQVRMFFVKYRVSILLICCCLTYNISHVTALDHDWETPVFTSPEPSSRYTTGDSPPVLEWTEISASDQYEIECGLDSEYSTPFSLFSSDNILDFSTLIDQVTWDSISFQLFLRVRALNSSMPVSKWSETTEFAKTRAGTTTIVTPVNDARFNTGDPLPIFKWEVIPGISDYVIEFAGDPNFTNLMGNFTFPGTEIDCNTSGDSAAWDSLTGTFYWRVWGLEDGLIPTPRTPSAQFSKTTEPPPVLVSPPNLTRFSGDSPIPMFTWEALPHSSPEYHIQFAYGSPSFPAGGSYIPVTTTSFSFSSVDITQEMWSQFFGKLNWRVAGLDSYGNPGGFSQAFSFVKVSDWNYMAYGDSITGGYGASNWETGFAGYPPMLQTMLRQRYGSSVNVFSQMDKSWFSGGHAYTGDEKINNAMEYHGPGKVLIMFGVIDIVDPGAPGCEDYDCHTIEHLIGIINKICLYNATPYIATLTPVNPVSDRAFLQDRVEELNVEIRSMASNQGVTICDLEQAFFESSLPLESYYNYDQEEDKPDWAHFNDAGYQIIAEAWNELL
ncbi:SGNH/GDSL hydrolase family protein [bacterium]|nr:SGNH/GDSL hydrolase family protein [bacterium]